MVLLRITVQLLRHYNPMEMCKSPVGNLPFPFLYLSCQSHPSALIAVSILLCSFTFSSWYV